MVDNKLHQKLLNTFKKICIAMENQRKSKRVSCLVPVDGKKGSAFDQTQTFDFSKGGLGFISQHKIPINKEIPIELDFGDQQEPVFVLGQVRWVRPIADSSQFRIGVFFKDILQGSRSRLNKHFQIQK